MKFKFLVLLGLVISLSACAGKSDSLGLVDNEQTKTYAEAYAPARTALMEGNIATLLEKLDQQYVTEDGDKMSRDDIIDELVKKNSELSIIERGLLMLNSGNFEKALLYFDAAEIKMEQTEAESGMYKFGSTVAKGGIASLLGAEEINDYTMRGYEKVMLYNYKALCYMLLGDRKAYNVTRRAIDKQQEEWEKFKELLAKFEEKKAEQNAETKEIASQIDVDTRDADTKKKAELVPNAYVNPFGDYMNALLMELDSIDDKSIRDNSIIAYKKVLENNKDCATATTAIKEVRKGLPKGKKLVHILLADGFSPERKESTQGYQIDKLKAVVNFATATPIPSNVLGARVSYAGAKQNFSSLSKMESIILRDDQDRLPFRTAMVTLALLRSGAASAFLGDLGVGLVAKMQRPDTRSWLTLPNKVIVARLYVPNATKQLTIETFDANKKTMAQTSVAIADKGPTVVYAVSYDKQLSAFANKNSWIINK